jgi:hypothetical protein
MKKEQLRKKKLEKGLRKKGLRKKDYEKRATKTVLRKQKYEEETPGSAGIRADRASDLM